MSKNKKDENTSHKSKKERREELKKPTIGKWIKGNIVLIAVVGVFILIAAMALSQDPQSQTVMGASEDYEGIVVEMHYFHLPTCPHCIKQNEFNNKLIEAYPNLRIYKYNMELRESQERLQEFIENDERLQNERIGTPTTIIGYEYNIGFGSDETTGLKLIEMIKNEQERQEYYASLEE